MDSATRRSHDAVLRDNADRFLGRLLDAPPDARRPLLDALKVDDPELFALVDSLFAHFDAVDDDDGFLAQPIAAPPLDEGEDFAGMRFGHWQVIRPIGRGGMGLVFEVERADGVVRQRAALKLIKRSFDNRSIITRFHTERQILAQLDHPSIARLIDAGAADDRPYLVMEYVAGVPLDRWCDDEALSIEARIELFNRICTAVHYAHQRLVVHRDLKPTNILITEDGTPKLLDFGISKLVNADGASAASAETIDASALLTPRYASPEQLTGAPISTASDIYSLGVLLFELLTGTVPYLTKNDSIVETMRVVMTEEPLRPSVAALRSPAPSAASAHPVVHSGMHPDRQRLAKRLRGDLDHIVIKALQRDPAERYESVAALRDDLVRHLAGDPIEATAPTWRYRAGKFVRKHRTAVAAATMVALVVIGLGLFAGWEAYRAEGALVVAETQRTAAERRFEDTRSLAKVMLFELDGAIASGPTKAREQLVRTAVTYLDRLSQDRLSDDLQREVAAGYEHIAEILGSDITKNLGRSVEARDYLTKALKLRERLVAVDPNNPLDLAGLVDCNMSLAVLARREGHIEQAAGYLDAALGAATRRVAVDADDVDSALKVFTVRRMQAIVEYYPDVPSLNRYDDASASFRRLIDDVESFGHLHPAVPRPIIDRHLNSYLHDYAQVADQGGQLQIALAAARRSLALSEASASARPDDPIEMRKLMLASDTAGMIMLETGDATAGMALLERATILRRKLAAADPDSATAAYELTEGFARMGSAYEAVGRPRDALVQFEQWVRHAEQAAARLTFRLHDPLDLAAARTALAHLQLAQGDAGHALDGARRAEREVLAFDREAAARPMALQALGEARIVIARALPRSGDHAASFALAQEGLRTLEANAAAESDDVFAARALQRGRIEAGLMAYDDRASHAAGCSLIETGRDALSRLRQQDRLAVRDFAIVEQASRALVRCGARGSAKNATW